MVQPAIFIQLSHRNWWRCVLSVVYCCWLGVSFKNYTRFKYGPLPAYFVFHTFSHVPTDIVARLIRTATAHLQVSSIKMLAGLPVVRPALNYLISNLVFIFRWLTSACQPVSRQSSVRGSLNPRADLVELCWCSGQVQRKRKWLSLSFIRLAPDRTTSGWKRAAIQEWRNARNILLTITATRSNAQWDRSGKKAVKIV